MSEDSNFKNTHLRSLYQLSRRLNALLETENAALLECDHEAVLAQVQEKTDLAKGYEKLARLLRASPEVLDEIDDRERESLLASEAQLKRLSKQNGRLLEAQIKARQLVVDMIAEAARSSRADAGTYSPQGDVGKLDPRGRDQASLAVDKTL